MVDFGRQKIDDEYYDKHIYQGKNMVNMFTDFESPFQKYRISKVLQIYTPNKNERVLDLGCGWGTFCFAMADLCWDITGVDFSKNSIDICHRILEEKKLTNVKFVFADAQNTEFESGSYDVVICADLFEHLYPEDSERVFDECRRILRTGGKLVVWTPNKGHFLEFLRNNNIILKRAEGHVDYKSMSNLIDSLNRKRFSIKKNYFAESHIPVLRGFERLFMGILPLLRRRIAILAEKDEIC